MTCDPSSSISSKPVSPPSIPSRQRRDSTWPIFALVIRRRLALFGNIDVTRLAGTPEDVVQEVTSTVKAGKQGGGYLFHSDHSVPSDVSLENYRLALETLEDAGRF
ncbi:MAG TPA: hypothetical protein DGN59_02030 [Candidatus Latescibacteria bacterium]|nr:hypothetical protein [Candidatus Latescibacterota bacterium]